MGVCGKPAGFESDDEELRALMEKPRGLRARRVGRTRLHRKAKSAIDIVKATGVGDNQCVVMLVFDVRALQAARAAWRARLEMTPRHPDTAFPCDDVVDLGIGDEEHEELFGGPAYRTIAKPIRVVRGAPLAAIKLLRNAVVRGVAFIVVAVAALAVTAFTPSHPHSSWTSVSYPR